MIIIKLWIYFIFITNIVTKVSLLQKFKFFKLKIHLFFYKSIFWSIQSYFVNKKLDIRYIYFLFLFIAIIHHCIPLITFRFQRKGNIRLNLRRISFCLFFNHLIRFCSNATFPFSWKRCWICNKSMILSSMRNVFFNELNSTVRTIFRNVHSFS
jgi:hypothetical protein